MWWKVTFWLFFFEVFRISCCILPTNLKNRQFQTKLSVFENCQRNTTASTKTFTEKQLGHNFALHFISYVSIALSKILPHLKTNAKKLSVFGKKDSPRFYSFLETRIFWKFDHISRPCNQINYRDIWFAKAIIILIMTAQVLFINVFLKKKMHLNAVEKYFSSICFWILLL